MPSETRLDSYLVQNLLARSRNQAQRMIKTGQVEVAGIVTLRPATPVGPDQIVRVQPGVVYVSRAANKLTQALEVFSVPSLKGKWAVDIGASTGGFTQVLLERGSSHVFSIDVGQGQLALELLEDKRVFSLESTDARTIGLDWLIQIAAARGEAISRSNIGLVAIDVSFISLKHFLDLFSQEFAGIDIIALFKPQFEVGRGGLGKNGLVRSPELAESALKDFEVLVKKYGGKVIGVEKSVVVGTHGNQEFLLWITFPQNHHQREWSAKSLDNRRASAHTATQNEEV